MASLEESFSYVHPDDRISAAKTLAAAIEWRARYRDEFRLNSTDGERWVASHGILVMDNAGDPVRMVGVVQDITARKRAEAHQKLLLDELNHRVKNTLLTVQSVAMQMARETESPKRFYQDFKTRLLALSHAHDLLTRGAWQGASLRELIQQTLAPYASGSEPRAVLEGQDIWLKPRTAVGLAMAIQELATNAAKHGALSAAGGRVAVNWHGGESDPIEIRWLESGGPQAAPPRRRGFGTRLLERGLAYEFKAEVKLDFAPAGLQCRIRLPA
jgi:two-component sensor histidine kinase